MHLCSRSHPSLCRSFTGQSRVPAGPRLGGPAGADTYPAAHHPCPTGRRLPTARRCRRRPDGSIIPALPPSGGGGGGGGGGASSGVQCCLERRAGRTCAAPSERERRRSRGSSERGGALSTGLQVSVEWTGASWPRRPLDGGPNSAARVRRVWSTARGRCRLPGEADNWRVSWITGA